mgnify:CR=1 FL=1
MATGTKAQELFQAASPKLTTWGQAFINAKRAEGLARSTLYRAYSPILSAFFAFCKSRSIDDVEAIDPALIRDRLLEVAETHAPSTVHRHYRTLRTWLLWYEAEAAPDGWRNPIRRVKAPKVPEQVLDPAPLADLSAMVKRADVRDRAILLTLVDTGLRASELLGLNLTDFDQAEGVLTVRHGKGGRVRVAPLGPRTRRAVRQWLRARQSGGLALYSGPDGRRLTYWGLREVLRRLAKRAQVRAPTLHSIRRAFAIGMLRAGVDLLTLSRLMGHGGLTLLARYAKQTVDDLRATVEHYGMADRLG